MTLRRKRLIRRPRPSRLTEVSVHVPSATPGSKPIVAHLSAGRSIALRSRHVIALVKKTPCRSSGTGTNSGFIRTRNGMPTIPQPNPNAPLNVVAIIHMAKPATRSHTPTASLFHGSTPLSEQRSISILPQLLLHTGAHSDSTKTTIYPYGVPHNGPQKRSNHDFPHTRRNHRRARGL